MSGHVQLTVAATAAADKLLAVVTKNRTSLSALVSQTYEVDEHGTARVMRGCEHEFDRAFSWCLAQEGDSIAILAAIGCLRADETAWKHFQDRTAEIVAGASKWGKMASLMAAPVGRA